MIHNQLQDVFVANLIDRRLGYKNGFNCSFFGTFRIVEEYFYPKTRKS